MSDVYEADRRRLAMGNEPASIRSQTQGYFDLDTRGIDDSSTAGQACGILQIEHRRCSRNSTLGRCLALAGLAVLGYQVSGLVDQMMTPAGVSLLQTSLGTALQTAAAVTGGMLAWAAGSKMRDDNLYQSLKADVMREEIQAVAIVVAQKPSGSGRATDALANSTTRHR